MPRIFHHSTLTPCKSFHCIGYYSIIFYHFNIVWECHTFNIDTLYCKLLLSSRSFATDLNGKPKVNFCFSQSKIIWINTEENQVKSDIQISVCIVLYFLLIFSLSFDKKEKLQGFSVLNIKQKQTHLTTVLVK